MNDTITAPPGADLMIGVLLNDQPGSPSVALDPATVRLVDPNSGAAANTVALAGRGAFQAASNGTVSFTPVPGFDATSTITYQVADANGTTTRATILVNEHHPTTSVRALPEAGGSPGRPVTLDPLTNDQPSAGAHWIASSLCLVEPVTGSCASTVTVSGTGTWLVLPHNKVRFTAVLGYTGTATIRYRAIDSAGLSAESTLTADLSTAASAPADSQPTGSQPTGLSYTGAPVDEYLRIGLGMLVLGLALSLMGRRRRRGQHAAVVSMWARVKGKATGARADPT